MEPWTPITPKDIYTYLSPIQVEALRQNGDPLPQIIKDTIARVRLEVNCSTKTFLAHDPTLIPVGVKTATCHLIIEALQTRIPSLKLSDDQIRNSDNARMLLRRFTLDELTADSIIHHTPLVINIDVALKRKRQASLNSLNGL